MKFNFCFNLRLNSRNTNEQLKSSRCHVYLKIIHVFYNTIKFKEKRASYWIFLEKINPPWLAVIKCVSQFRNDSLKKRSFSCIVANGYRYLYGLRHTWMMPHHTLCNHCCARVISTPGSWIQWHYKNTMFQKQDAKFHWKCWRRYIAFLTKWGVNSEKI